MAAWASMRSGSIDRKYSKYLSDTDTCEPGCATALGSEVCPIQTAAASILRRHWFIAAVHGMSIAEMKQHSFCCCQLDDMQSLIFSSAQAP